MSSDLEIDSSISADFAHFLSQAVPVYDRSRFSERHWNTIERCARKLFIGVKAIQSRNAVIAAKSISSIRKQIHSSPPSLQNAFQWISAGIWDPNQFPGCLEEISLSA